MTAPVRLVPKPAPAPTTEEVERLIDVATARALLGVSASAVYRWCRAGKVAHYKLGKSLKFRASDLEAWVQTTRRGGRR